MCAENSVGAATDLFATISTPSSTRLSWLLPWRSISPWECYAYAALLSFQQKRSTFGVLLVSLVLLLMPDTAYARSISASETHVEPTQQL